MSDVEADRKLVELSFLHEIAQLASSAADWDEMLKVVIERTNTALRAEVSSLYLLERREGILRLVATNGLNRRGIGRVTLRLGEGITGWVASSRRPLAVRDVRNEPRWKRISTVDADRFRSMLSVPLLARGDVIGVMNIQTVEERLFPRAEIDFLQTIANNVAGIIDKGRLQREAERKLREVSALFEVSDVLTRTLDLGEVLRLVVDRLARVYPGGSALLLLRDEHGAHERARAGVPPRAAVQAARDALAEARTVVGDDHLALPLVAGERLLGAVGLHVPGGEGFAPEEVAFVGTLANQAALAIDKASLYALERKTADDLRAVEQARAELVAIVTHDLRTPLSLIRGHLDLIEGGAAPAASVQEAIHQVERLDQLIDRILSSVRDDRPGLVGRLVRVDLRALVVAAVRDAGPIARRHRLSGPRSGGTPLWVRADRRRTAEVVAGLIHNATKYAPPGTRIAVRLTHGRDRAIVRVVDEGPGVRPEDRRRIFEAFGRSDEFRAVPGSGIGLYASRRVMEAQGGDIWLEDAPGGGSAFAFSLPLIATAERS